MRRPSPRPRCTWSTCSFCTGVTGSYSALTLPAPRPPRGRAPSRQRLHLSCLSPRKSPLTVPVDFEQTTSSQQRTRAPKARGATLMLVENMSVPADRRVWPQCQALRDAGFEVVVVCPQGEDADRLRFERHEGVEIHRFPAAGGSNGFVVHSTGNGAWTTQMTMTEFFIFGIWGSGTNDIYGVGEGGTI